MLEKILLGDGSKAPAWIGTLFGSSNDTARAITTDGGGNVIICGTSDASGSDDIQIAKYNKYAVLQWQRRLGGSAADKGYGIATDSAGNIYVCGEANFGGIVGAQIARFSSSGSLDWQQRLYQADHTQIAYSLTVEPSGNIVVCGYTNYASSENILLAKYSPSGSLIWQLRDGNEAYAVYGKSVATDSNGNICVTGFTNLYGYIDYLTVKHDSNGNILWQRNLGQTGSSYARSIAVDTSGNVYVCGTSTGAGTLALFLAKYSTSGTLLWQRRLGGDLAGSCAGYGVSVDGTGAVYVCGHNYIGYSQNLIVAKYNGSGVIQWQRSLTASDCDTRAFAISTDKNNSLLICGELVNGGNTEIFLGKLPSDGSLTGTYTLNGLAFTYAASSLIDVPGNLYEGSSSISSAGSELTAGASPFTAAASMLSSTVTKL